MTPTSRGSLRLFQAWGVTGETLIGEELILAHLDNHEPVPAEARAHRLKADKARRRYLEEESECPPQPATR